MEVKIKKVLTLIRSHYEKDEETFKNVCLEIEKECDGELGAFILAQIGETNTFVPGGGDTE